MDLRITQLELIEMLLNTKKGTVLNKVRIILEKEQDEFTLTKAQYKIIDKRRDKYLNGKGKSLSWLEVKQHAIKEIS